MVGCSVEGESCVLAGLGNQQEQPWPPKAHGQSPFCGCLSRGAAHHPVPCSSKHVLRHHHLGTQDGVNTRHQHRWWVSRERPPSVPVLMRNGSNRTPCRVRAGVSREAGQAVLGSRPVFNLPLSTGAELARGPEVALGCLQWSLASVALLSPGSGLSWTKQG